MVGVNDKIIAALITGGVALLTMIVTSLYNSFKARLEREKWYLSRSTSRDNTSGWLDDIDRIAKTPNTEINQSDLLALRLCFGVFSFNNNNQKGNIKVDGNTVSWTDNAFEEYSEYRTNLKTNEKNNKTLEVKAWVQNNDFDNFNNYDEFKNNAIKFLNLLIRDMQWDSNYRIDIEDGNILHMICRELQQDRWDFYKYNERKSEIMSTYKFFSFLDSFSKNKNIMMKFNYLVILFLSIIVLGVICTLCFSTLNNSYLIEIPLMIILFLSLASLIIIILGRYNKYISEIKQLTQQMARMKAQRKHANEVLTELLKA